jgi:hypothetical protein
LKEMPRWKIIVISSLIFEFRSLMEKQVDKCFSLQKHCGIKLSKTESDKKVPQLKSDKISVCR